MRESSDARCIPAVECALVVELGLAHGDPTSHMIVARHAGRWSRAFPKGLASTLFLHGAGLLQATGVHGADAASVTKGHTMNPNPKRRYGPPGPQPVRRKNGAGDARQNYERYLARAHEAKLAGDVIEMENWYQHAEHYFRVMRGTGDDRRY